MAQANTRDLGRATKLQNKWHKSLRSASGKKPGSSFSLPSIFHEILEPSRSRDPTSNRRSIKDLQQENVACNRSTKPLWWSLDPQIWKRWWKSLESLDPYPTSLWYAIKMAQETTNNLRSEWESTMVILSWLRKIHYYMTPSRAQKSKKNVIKIQPTDMEGSKNRVCIELHHYHNNHVFFRWETPCERPHKLSKIKKDVGSGS